MAKKTKDDSPGRVTKKDFEKWSKVHDGLTDQKAFDAMAKVRNAYEQSRSYLLTSCFWYAYQQQVTGEILAGGSWYDKWNKHEKQALMWYRQPSEDDFVSNIKSPMARGRINTFVNWMKKLNLEFGAKPNSPEDEGAAVTADTTIDYSFRSSNAAQVLGDCWEELGIHGNAFFRVFYVKEQKKARFPKTTGLTKEQKKAVDNGDKIIYGPEQTIDVNDNVAFEFVPIREIHPDPQGRNLHGDTYRAGWIVRRRFVTQEYLEAVFGDHPRVKYLDQVKPASAYNELTEYFFQPPQNEWAHNIVELLEMEDQDNDKYYVVANDVPIIGWNDDEPLPYNHKEISYHKLDFIRVPGQFYSIGICDLLENIQASYEIALNMVADYVYRTYNYRLLVDADNLGEVVEGMERTGDVFVPLDVSDGRPLNSKIMPLQPAPISFDIFQFLELLERNATMATNIDPTQMALQAVSKTATSDILNKELLMTMIGGVVTNNVNGDLRSAGRQVFALQQQEYPKERVREIIGEDGKKKKTVGPKVLRLDGMEIKINDDTSKLEAAEIEDNYSYFEVKDEYINTKNELDIYIKPESQEVTSPALEEQRMAEEFAQMVPFAVDPNNPQQVMTHKMPMVNAVKLFEKYFDKRRLPHDLLLSRSKDDKRAIKEAETHVMGILAGEHVQATPGQSTEHLEYEYRVLDALMFERDKKQEEMDADMEKQAQAIAEEYAGVPQFDPYTGQAIELPVPTPNERLADDIDKLTDTIEKLEKHVTIESMPASLKNSRIVMMQSQPEEPTESAEAPMPVGSQNQVTPEMINAEVPAEQVPMGQVGVGPQGPPLV